MNLSNYQADELLRDGGSVHIRAARPDDRERLQEMFGRLSQESIYLRFMGYRKRLSENELEKLTRPDFRDDVVLVATLRRGEEERIIAMALYTVDPASGRGGEKHAEVAFLVEDAHQGRGTGTLLLEHLARIARRQGISGFEASTLGENNRMLRVFSDSGFRVKRALDAGIFLVSFPTEETEDYVQASVHRIRTAAARSVEPIFKPRSIAVIGASREENSVGNSVVKNLQASGFTGPVHPVNPKADEILGLKCYPDVLSIGEPPELAVITVPAKLVEKVLAQCSEAGVRAVVVITAGFAEVGGKEAETRLRRLVRESGMRMVGPNCLGVLNTNPDVKMNATFTSLWPPNGNIGFLSQSGALGIAILDYARNTNLGISQFISVGNKADVSGNDLISFWSEDEDTDVIVLYLESFGNPRKFARLAPEIARRKPIIAVKAGRTQAGTRAASSHSAALASLDVAVDALFEQAGIIRTDTMKQLFDVAGFLSNQPVPKGGRIGVVTNAGGPGILLADACEGMGLELPTLSEHTVARLREFALAEAALGNPVDLVASAPPAHFEKAIEIVGADPGVDALVALYIPTAVTSSEDAARALAKGIGKLPKDIPASVVFIRTGGAPEELHGGPRGRLPVYGFPEDAARVLWHARRYGAWREKPRGEFFEISAFEKSAIRSIVDRVLEGRGEPLWVGHEDLMAMLKVVGIHVAEAEELAPDQAPEAAGRLGYPLVAKAVAPGIVHKSDVGGIILGLNTKDAVKEAVKTLRERMERADSTLEAVLLQRQVKGGQETLVGVTSDPTFGPLIVVGMGGVLVELLKDTAFRLPPVSDLDAREMLEELRSAPLLEGYRGAPAADKEALIELITRLSALVQVIPELREMDLNPVKVLEPGEGAIVVDARMRLEPVD